MDKLHWDEIEHLGYYDFMAYLGVAYFQWGGFESTKRLLEMCGVSADKRVLAVGCGTGYSACRIALTYECEVVGVDISELMIARARERVDKLRLENLVHFEVGDAYNLAFDDESFDIVLTQFVTIFLDKPRVFTEFVRVLRHGGYLGVNEICKEEHIPAPALEKISKAERDLEESIGLSFNIPTPGEWHYWFEKAGLVDIDYEINDDKYSLREYADAMGGWRKFLSVTFKTLYYLSRSKNLRQRYMPMGRAKDVLIRHRDTSQYINLISCVGRKS